MLNFCNFRFLLNFCVICAIIFLIIAHERNVLMDFKSTFNIVKNYRWQSLFFYYWKLLAIAVAVPSILCLVFFSYSQSADYLKEYTHTFTISSLKSMSNFELLTNKTDIFYSRLSQDPATIYFFHNRMEENSINDISNYSMLNDELSSFVHTNDFIASVYMYSIETGNVISNTEFNSLDKFSDRTVIDRVIGSKADKILYFSSRDEKNYLSIAYDMRTVNYNITDGYLIINVDYDELYKYLVSDVNSGETLAFFTKSGIPLTDIKSVPLSGDKISAVFADNAEKINAGEYISSNKGSSIYCLIPHPDKNIVLLSQTLSNSMYGVLKNSIGSIIITLLCTLLLTIVLSFLVSVSIYKSIAVMVSAMGLLGNHADSNTNEIDFISENFMRTLTRNSEIERELTSKIKQLKDSQALALQTQINPHFIFNTLNLVNIMIIRITQKDCPPAQILALLSDVLYYSLKTDNFITSLRDELYYTQKYIQIEQLKHENLFQYEENIDESLLDCKTVKFILQPIMENSIEHGFKNISALPAKLTLTISAENDVLHIIIRDNGSGVSSETLSKMQSRLKSSDVFAESRHIGLQNVNKRIKLIFGEEYGVFISAPKGGGLLVEIIQPLHF